MQINVNKFMKYKKVYFILIFCILSIVGFFYYEKNKPTSVESMMKEADSLEKKGQVAYAIENYNKIVRVFPNNYEAHIALAKLYVKAEEIDLAKVEYIKAIDLRYKFKYEANIAMANFYVQENKYILAENFIKSIKDIKDKKALQRVGDFYYKWGLILKTTDKTEAIRKFKTAFKFYKSIKSPTLATLKKEIINTYIDISNDLLNANNYQDAKEILKISLDFSDNAETHFKLAKIYEKQGQIDKALDEYNKAFKLNPSADKINEYAALLIKKAEICKENGDKVSTDLYYTLAKNLDSKINIPMNPDDRVLINNLESKYNQNLDKDILIPEISFKLTNISKEKIKYLKIKVVFSENNNPFSEEIKDVATEKNPLNNDSSTSEMNIFSSKPINYVLDKHNLLAQIYVSQQNPDEWVLFRNVKMIWEMNSDIIIQNKD